MGVIGSITILSTILLRYIWEYRVVPGKNKIEPETVFQRQGTGAETLTYEIL